MARPSTKKGRVTKPLVAPTYFMISISRRRANTLRRMVLPTVMMLTDHQHQHDAAAHFGNRALHLHKDVGHFHRGGNAVHALNGLHLLLMPPSGSDPRWKRGSWP